MAALSFLFVLAAAWQAVAPSTLPATAAPATPAPTAAPSPEPSSVAPRPGGSPPPTLPASSGAPSAAPSALRSTVPDHAASLVGGVWQCETIAGSTGTHTYTQDEDDGSIEMQTVLRMGFHTFRITEVYRYDEPRAVWTAQTAGGAYRGTAGPWTGPKWIFDGTAAANGRQRPVRMVYFNLGAQAFRRDFQARQDGQWRTYSAETCTRPSS